MSSPTKCDVKSPAKYFWEEVEATLTRCEQEKWAHVAASQSGSGYS